MAKKTHSIEASADAYNPYAKAPTRYEGEFVGDLTGNVTGNLYGNADTATSLAAPFTVSVAGDATGSFSTSGKNATLRLKVAQAQNAEYATTADTAKAVQEASYAQHAGSASNADYAREAGDATNAEIAQHAISADTATQAGRAALAAKAQESDHAALADVATTAKQADKATTADVALSLQNSPDNPIPYASYAQRAGIAQIAQYDCMGRSFTNYYALKSELEPYKGMLTEKEANHLYLKREEKITQAVVRGRAYGSGYVDGNTLRIFIESICSSGDELWNIYNDLIVGNFPDVTEADTNKVYVDLDGIMHLWDHNNRCWMTVTGELPEATKQELADKIKYLETLLQHLQAIKEDVVTVHGKQTIEGPKEFHHLVRTPIADIDKDNARTVVVVHNLKDVRDKIHAELNEGLFKLIELYRQLEDRLDAQQLGDILMSGKDLTIPENQTEMATRTIYLNYLDADKRYIPADPETWLPLDQSKTPEITYFRQFVKSTTGVVTWIDKRATIDPTKWVPWDTQTDGNGNPRRDILLDQTAQLKSYNSTGEKKNLISLSASDTVQTGTQETGYNINALNGKVTINGEEIIATISTLDGYLPLSGGQLTGDLLIPNIPVTTDGLEVMNSHVVRELIDSKIREHNNNLNLSKYMPKAGGVFTGLVQVPDSLDLEAARGSADVLNAKAIEQLIGMVGKEKGWVHIEFLDHTPLCAELEDNVLYSVPAYEFDTNSEIKSIRVNSDNTNNTPTEGEGIIFGTTDVLS